MTCENYKHLMMGYLDDELTADERKALEAHMTGCALCRAELDGFRKLKSITEDVALVEPEDKVWDQYWGNLYNRLERGLGWILFGISAILLLIYGGFKMIEEIIRDPGLALGLKIGLLALVAGLAILLVSLVRERLYFRSRDRYKDVRR